MYKNHTVERSAIIVLRVWWIKTKGQEHGDKPLQAEWTSDTRASHPQLLEPAGSSHSPVLYCSDLDKPALT
jgi:hypothetical protein